jgi:hypothetical protein
MSWQEINDTRLAHPGYLGKCQLKTNLNSRKNPQPVVVQLIPIHARFERSYCDIWRPTNKGNIMAFELRFPISPIDPLNRPEFVLPPASANPLGPLADLPGTWHGNGFNQIWRPFNPTTTSDRFLELNLTEEVLEFSPSLGSIPNRGLLQADIELAGIHYLQQIKDTLTGKGIHVEPGLWVTVPVTSNPAEPTTVVRMASIPHGATVNAQGTALTVPGGPIINPVSIRPFGIGAPPPANTAVAFPPFNEANLAVATPLRLPNPIPASITQAMVNNPNSLLTAAIAGQTITQTTVLIINTQAPAVPPPPAAPDAGGGTDNIAFLQGGPAGPNADAAQMTAIFWIEHVAATHHEPAFLQLQYTQTVLLNFNGLSWPHVSVATLRKHKH